MDKKRAARQKSLTELGSIEITMRKLDRELHSAGYHDFLITAGHAIKGVRTNGVERRTTLLDSLKALDTDIKSADLHINDMRCIQDKAESQLSTLRLILSEFSICKICGGEQGTGVCGSPRNPWEDCSNCNGYGIHLKSGSQISHFTEERE